MTRLIVILCNSVTGLFGVQLAGQKFTPDIAILFTRRTRGGHDRRGASSRAGRWARRANSQAILATCSDCGKRY